MRASGGDLVLKCERLARPGGVERAREGGGAAPARHERHAVEDGRLAQLAPLALFAMALFGVLFSLYLTYLEPFVIRAVCIWCLSNAVIITLIMIFTAGRASDALAYSEEMEA